MPRPTRAYGRPGTLVIPAGWGAGHAPVMDGTMTGVASLRLPGFVSSAWDDTLERTVPVPHTPYATDIPVRVQAHRETSNGDDSTVAEESVKITGYLITLSRRTPGTDQVEAGHLIDMTGSDDPLLTGVTFKVTELVRGTLRFERDLFAIVYDPTSQTTGGE